MSLDLLSVLSSREDYYRYKRFIKETTVPSEVWTIIQDLDGYFDSHTTTEEVDWEEFSTWFALVKHPSFKSEKLNVFKVLFKSMEEYTPSEVAESIVEKYITQDYCVKISDVTLRGAEGESVDLDKVRAYLEDFDQELNRATKLETFIVSEDISEIASEVLEGGLEWNLDYLNKSIGSLRTGKLVCFAARPNTGKTTWLASEAVHLASQLEEDQVILWFNNEEAGKDVKFRISQAGIMWTAEEIHDDPVKALAEYEKKVGNKDKIILVDKADISTKDIEEYLRNYNVGAIIVDQLWKVHGFEKTSSTDTARLGAVYQWAREMAKKYAPFITVHQVKTEGDGVDYLTPNMLYLSGTVIQGEVDSLIMMGRVYEPHKEDVRYLAIGKNKGAYGPKVEPNMREGKAEVRIVADRAYFEED